MLQKLKPNAIHWIDAFRRQSVRKPGRNCPTASVGNNKALKLPVQLRRTKLPEDWLSALRSADLDKVRSSVAYAFVADDHSRSTRVGLAIRHGNIHFSHLCLHLFNRIAQTLGPCLSCNPCGELLLVGMKLFALRTPSVQDEIRASLPKNPR